MAALYSEDMTSVYSGGLVYEYTVEANGYGLVEVSSNGNVVPDGDFDRLKNAYAATSNPSGDGGARTSTTPPQCQPESEEWAVSIDRLPVIPASAKQFIRDGAGTGPGLGGGESSQRAGTPSATEPDLSNGVITSDSVANSTSKDSSSEGDSSSTGDNATNGTSDGSSRTSGSNSFSSTDATDENAGPGKLSMSMGIAMGSSIVALVLAFIL